MASATGYLAKIVQNAAEALSCPFAILYLAEPSGFRAASSFGLTKPVPDLPADHELLIAGRANKHSPLVIDDLEHVFCPHPPPAFLIEEQVGSIRFVAISKVVCEGDKTCFLLLVADKKPRASMGATANEVLRDHALRISLLFELLMLRDADDDLLNDPELHGVPQLEAQNFALEVEIEAHGRIAAQLLYAATHDELTMLHNRQFFMDRIVNAFERSAADPHFQFAVLLMDLDRFKYVNDTLGHREGDFLLVEVARRLRASTRPSDVLARIGGDEFALLIDGLEDIAVTEALTQRIINTVRLPSIRIGRVEITTSCSIGIVRAPQHGRTPDDLLNNADIAMYTAKRQRLGFCLFKDGMQNEMSKNAQLRVDLEKAIARNEFYLLYQPICRVDSMQIVGFEALVRWQHPRRGVMLPETFIAVAESSGLIRQLGLWVLHTACSQLKLWQDQLPAIDLEMSVNVSGEQLKDVGFIVDLEETLGAAAIPASSLQLEVTESVFLAAIQTSQELIARIRSLGVSIALDDFGMGYSSLSYLDLYPVDTIKIDRSFISNMTMRPRTMAVVQAIIQLGRALGVKVTAEGVENNEQRQALNHAGCTFAQGHLFGAPLSPVQATNMLKRIGGKARNED